MKNIAQRQKIQMSFATQLNKIASDVCSEVDKIFSQHYKRIKELLEMASYNGNFDDRILWKYDTPGLSLYSEGDKIKGKIIEKLREGGFKVVSEPEKIKITWEGKITK